ncbi:MAG: RNA polymerase subunit sigma [Candidatus Cloacimonadota bacterium]|nr:MAG: RNA polymerase subunit sigma [Candidatus Cloacimonadota bacterium]PIE79952.1 MAG: RNA polymerase subunit sigma [Candidatus Delongbacteria bacterium]
MNRGFLVAKESSGGLGRSNQLLDKYLQEIGEEELLTAEEEVKLSKKMRAGGRSGDRAMEKLVRANLRFVVSVAKQYQNQGLTLNDLINEGNMGLIKAAKRFDETKGFKFISYAVWWIRQSILQALAEQSRVVRLPLNKVGALNKIAKTMTSLEQKYEREPTPEEIANTLDTTELEITDTLKISGRHLSMDAPFNPGDDNRLLDVLKNDKEPPPDVNLFDESLKTEITNVLGTLNEREREVIVLYFGIGKDQALTLEEIGEKFMLTRERVRQIKEKAIRRLRHASRSKSLRVYLG